MKATENNVLITGGTSGIGLALAKRFLDLGNEVIITGTNAAKAAEVQSQLPNIQIELADMCDRSSVDRSVAKSPRVKIIDR